jgi:hypothetical protein
MWDSQSLPIAEAFLESRFANMFHAPSVIIEA